MERGPLALFGAIVAVGLGPALWLGVQFGSLQIFTDRPPAVGEHRPGGQELVGGKGAAADATIDDPVIGSTPQSNVLPVTRSPSASPSARRPSSSPASSAPSRSPSAAPSASADPSASPSDASPTPSTSNGDPTRPADPPASGPVVSVSTEAPSGRGAARAY